MKSASQGFTLLELMIVVAMMGILAAIAIPAYIRYMQESKTAEARSNVQKIFWGAVSYYNAEHVERGFGAHTILSRRLPCDVVPTGSVWCPVGGPPRGKKTSQPKDCWTNNISDQGIIWKSLDFSIADHNYYAYRFVCTKFLTKDAFYAQAEGDLNGDGLKFSLFERTGYAEKTHDIIVGGAGIYVKDPLE